MSNRDLMSYCKAVLQFRHWKALYNMFRFSTDPRAFLRKYLFSQGPWPSTVAVKGKKGIHTIDVYTWHDVLTVNEIFFRKDYFVPKDAKVIVDFGSNIGISLLYFLDNAHPDCRLYAYEPVLENVEKLRKNVKFFDSQYELMIHAVGPHAGTMSFGVENTGRYGGINLQLDNTIQVNVLSMNDELEKIIDKHGVIDVVKIDIESLELEVLHTLEDNVLKKIRYISVEFVTDIDFAKSFFVKSRRGTINSFKNTMFC